MDGLYIDSKGTKQWYKNGRLHRIGGPAILTINGFKRWVINGITHRIGGPSVEYGDGTKDWSIYGVRYLEDEYNHVVSNIPLLYWNRFKAGLWL